MERMQQSFLRAFKVIDIGPRIASAFAAKYLAELGADVVRAESLAPDALRSGPPFIGEPTAEASALHLYINAGKRSVALDYDSHEGRAQLDALLASADLVFNGLGVAESRGLRITEDELSVRGANAVLVNVTSFGTTGPYREYLGDEIVTMALGGMMHLTGEPDREPLRPFGHVSEYQLGLNAVFAALVALFDRESRSLPQAVDVAGMETCVTLLENSIGILLRGGVVRGRNGNSFYAGTPFLDVYRCRDGFVTVTIGSETHWQMVCAVIGKPEWVDDPTMQDWGGRTVRATEIRGAIQAWCDSREKMDIFHSFQTYRMAVAPGYSIEEVLGDPQNATRDYFVAIDHPVAGVLQYPRPPFRASACEFAERRAPLLGEHTKEVLAEWTGRGH